MMFPNEEEQEGLHLERTPRKTCQGDGTISPVSSTDSKCL